MNQLPEILAVGVPGSLSFLLTSFTLISILLFSRTKLAPNRISNINRSSTAPLSPPEYILDSKSSGEWCIVGLLLSDLVKSIASQLSYVYLFNNVDIICKIQAPLLAFSILSSSFWSVSICFYAIQSIGLHSTSKISASAIRTLIICICIISPLLLTGSLFFYPTPFSLQESGAWCFISPSLHIQSNPHHYMHLAVSIVLIVTGYMSLITRLKKLKSTQRFDGPARVARFKRVIRRLGCYPVLFVILVLPFTVVGVLPYLGIVPPAALESLGIALIMMTGSVNSVLYIGKREIFSRYARLFGRRDGNDGNVNKRDTNVSARMIAEYGMQTTTGELENDENV
jgi:hypothetical protein